MKQLHFSSGHTRLRERTLLTGVLVEGPGTLAHLLVLPHTCPSPLTARSYKVNTSGTKASPFQSACTHLRASVWPRTLTMCGTTTSSLSPTPNQVPVVLAWAQGRREEGRKEPALQNLGACPLLEAPSFALSPCSRETLKGWLMSPPSRAAIVFLDLPCSLRLHSIECHQPRVVWWVLRSFLLRQVLV